MLKKIAATAVLSATVLLGTSPALADHDRYGTFDKRTVARDARAPYYGHSERRVVVRHVEHRPVVVRRHVAYRPVVVHRHAPPPPPAVVYHSSHSHDMLGGLIFGAVLGAAIASAGH
ncbi:MAG: hypothetical protein OEV81_03080 [Betaproteobacteria bacterium]|nr:hypothetical protein [Betaproteobacteria bacterium]MDH5219967.1 hypothetical protein [Betaproteobacteria bacterium]MDH5350791.1 hypothetical protein [Betaproteobacteria bacterium]